MSTIGSVPVKPAKSAPSRLRGAAWGLAFMIAAFIVALIIAPWQQTANGDGRVVALSPTQRRHDIDSPVDGRIAKWFVVEGSQVRVGEPIVEVVDNDPSVLDRLRAERRALVSRREAARLAKKTAGLNVERQRDLHAQGLSSRRQYEVAIQEQARMSADEAAADAEIVRLDVRLARQDNQVVRAPHDGIILRRGEGQGSILVKAGETLATLVPMDAPPAVELWLPGNDLPLVHVGQEARLQFEGWPAVQTAGWPGIAVGTFAGTVQVVDQADDGRGRFRVLIAPKEEDGWPMQLVGRQGVRAQGFLLAKQVRLGYELWRRFNGFPPIPMVSLTKEKS